VSGIKRYFEAVLMDSGPAEAESGASAKVKKDGHKGKIVKLYLMPKEEYELNEAMRLGGYQARSHLVMNLLHGQQTVTNWKRAQARRLLLDMASCGLTIADLEAETTVTV
jgi:hypothetical protein